MKQLKKTDVAIVGGGILGLAFALEAIRQQKKVTVFERNPRARGASVRNFGMIYPLGMRPGKIFERALRTRNLWLELGQSAKFWLNPCGSLLVARSKEEIVVLEEFVSSRKDIEGLSLLTPKEALKKSPGLVQEGLLGALWS
ncbi:MAG: FAD-dependent oxidoreductase, partial [Deltaproteobacteria bacterium]